MHSNGVSYRNLPKAADFRDDGLPVVTSASGARFDQRLEPGLLVEDFTAPREEFAGEMFQAFLAGYARAGYELLDLQRRGYTDELLELLEFSGHRARPRVPEVSMKDRLHALHVDLGLERKKLILVPRDEGGVADVWQDPAQTFLLVLALLVSGVDCREFLQGAGVRVSSPQAAELHRLLASLQGQPRVEPSAVIAPLGVDVGVEIALALHSRFGGRLPLEGPEAQSVVEPVLAQGRADQVIRLADLLVDVGLLCGHSLERVPENAVENRTSFSKFYGHLGISQVSASLRDSRSNESRLMGLMRGLNGYTWYSELQRRPKPKDSGDFAMFMELSRMHRRGFQMSVEESGAKQVLWSAGFRALERGRHSLQAVLVLMTYGEEDGITFSPELLPMVLQNHAETLVAMFQAAHEQARHGSCGWLPFFRDTSEGYTPLMQELQWATEFTKGLTERRLSPAQHQQFIQQGMRFLESGA